jgi:serine/threonine protein kinase
MESYQYELNVNVKQKRPLNGNFYKAEWIPRRQPDVILIVMNEETAKREASFYMKFTSHPHIIDTFGFVKNNLGLIMLLQERAPHGNLHTLLQNEEFQPSPKVLVGIFLQIVDAMIYITNEGVVHGDLRCANVLVFQMDSSEPTGSLVKLTNFSLARLKDYSGKDNKLSDSPVRYCAPEILRSTDGTNYSELSDVFSMGVLMWEACSKGEIPYGDHINDNDIREKKLKYVELPRPKECHSQIWSVIKGCCYNEQSLRFDFEGLKGQLHKIDFK